MPATKPQEYLKRKHYCGQTKSAFAIAATLAIIQPCQTNDAKEESCGYGQQDVLLNFFSGGGLALHAIRLGPVADKREKNWLGAPRSRLHAQRTRRSRPSSGPCRANVGRSQRVPHWLRPLKLCGIQTR